MSESSIRTAQAEEQARILDGMAEWLSPPILGASQAESLAALRAGSAALRARTDAWQPIETAPKDREFLGWYPYYATSAEGGSVFVTRWNDDKHSAKVRPYFEASGWVWGVRDLRSKQPTLWQSLPPLPSPPTPAQEEEK